MELSREWTLKEESVQNHEKKVGTFKILVGLNALRQGDPISRFPNEMSRLETYGLDLTGSCDSEYFMQGSKLSHGSFIKTVIGKSEVTKLAKGL